MWPQIIISSARRTEVCAKENERKKRAARTKEDSPLSEEELFGELDELIGLREVKETMREIYAFYEIQKRRRQAGLAAEPMVFHMVFRGAPGTGKTTVARIVGRILRKIGVLSSGHLVEAERADLVGEYIGHTAQRTREKVKRSLGGVLFIDEAYSLARGGEKDFGRESIDALVKAMEDHKDEFVLILAGYSDEMTDFLALNPGLSSRFPIRLDFAEHTQSQLLKIAERFCEKREYRMTETARMRLGRLLLEERCRQKAVFGNARTVRNLLEKAIRRQASRLLHQRNASREVLMQLEECDFSTKDGRETYQILAH